MGSRFGVLGIALWVVAATTVPARAAVEPTSGPADVVKQFVAAFSAHDLAAFLALAHPEIEWLSVTGSTVAVETSGSAALETSMKSYFESCPSCRSTIEVSAVNGNWVAATETAAWMTAAGVKRSQASLSVYEIVDGKIRRVWYYPAVRP